MPTKKKPAKKKSKKSARAPVSKTKSQEDFLLILIAASERAISPHGTSVDLFFTQQANRLRAELEALRGQK